MDVLQSKNQQKISSAKAVAQTATQTQLEISVLPPAIEIVETEQKPDFLTTVKNFAMRPVSAGSKIQYWHIAVGAVVAFVLYVEMVADRKTQRKLKFW